MVQYKYPIIALLLQDRTVTNISGNSPDHKNCRKDMAFGESLGMAMVAGVGAGAYHMDPLISSAAVAGASMTAENLQTTESSLNEMAKMVTHMKFTLFIQNMQYNLSF